MSFSSFFPWFVVFASFIVRVIVYGITYTSGIIYVIVLKNFQTGKADTSWISSIITTVMFAAGPPSGRLVKSLGWRVVAVVGGIIAGTGLLLTSLTSNLLFLILSYGFVTGFGCGMAYMVACVAVPAHFRGHRRQKMAVAMASCGSGVGTFIFSPIVQYVNVTYGWQNLFIVLAGVGVQCSSVGLLFRPLSVLSTTDAEKISEKIANWGFLKNVGFHIAHLGFFFAAFGDSIVYGHLGEYAETLGFTSDKGAYLYSVIGISVMILKLLQGVVLDSRGSTLLPIKLAIFFFFLGGVATFILFVSNEYIMLMIFATIFGANTAASGGAVVVGILETYYGHEHLELTFGVNLAVIGVGNLLGSPMAGLLFEAYETYTPVLILYCVTKVFSSLCFWLVYKFCAQTQKTHMTEVILSGKEDFLEDKAVLALLPGENVPLLVENPPPRYSDVIDKNMEAVF